MNRRQVLLGGLSALAVTAASPAVAGYSARKRRTLLSQAWNRAVNAGRPLMVLVIPEDDAAQSQRGRTLGLWLEQATDADLAPLAHFEPACARLSELAGLVPAVAGLREATLVVVRTDLPRTPFRAVHVPEVDDRVRQPPQPSLGDLSDEEYPQAWQAHRGAIAAERARVIHVHLAAMREALAPIYAEAAIVVPPTSVSSLAASARLRWVKLAPAGSHWASSGGCGVHVEPNPGDPERLPMMVSCGMGHMAVIETRFLHFWEV